MIWFCGAIASPGYLLVSVGDAFDIAPTAAKRQFRSPARTKRRWLRDHRRMMREHARRT